MYNHTAKKETHKQNRLPCLNLQALFVYFLCAVSYDETSETKILLCLYVLYCGRVGLAVKTIM